MDLFVSTVSSVAFAGVRALTTASRFVRQRVTTTQPVPAPQPPTPHEMLDITLILARPYGEFAREPQVISPEVNKKLNDDLEDVMCWLESYQVGTVQWRYGGPNPEWRAKYRKNRNDPVNIETDIEFTAKVDKHYIHLTFPHESPLVERMHQGYLCHNLYMTLAYNMNQLNTTLKHEALILSKSPDGSMKKFRVTYVADGTKKTFHFTSDNWWDVTVFLDILLGNVGTTITKIVQHKKTNPHQQVALCVTCVNLRKPCVNHLRFTHYMRKPA
jgi:hypothetical protein